MALGHTDKCGGARRGHSLQPQSYESHNPREGTPLFRSLCISHLSCLAVAKPTLANDLFPGMTGRQIASLLPRLSWACPFSSSVLSLPWTRERLVVPWGEFHCSSLAKRGRCHADRCDLSFAPFQLLITGFITKVSILCWVCEWTGFLSNYPFSFLALCGLVLVPPLPPPPPSCQLGFYCVCAQRRIFPFYSFFFPTWGNGHLFPGEIGKPVLSPSWGLESLPQRRGFPRGCGKALAS